MTNRDKYNYSKFNIPAIEVMTVELSPEEKKRIYEEEKARLEAREQIERERKKYRKPRSLVFCQILLDYYVISVAG